MVKSPLNLLDQAKPTIDKTKTMTTIKPTM
jgi:hypothetical protein